jgi:hypothetical protein
VIFTSSVEGRWPKRTDFHLSSTRSGIGAVRWFVYEQQVPLVLRQLTFLEDMIVDIALTLGAEDKAATF